MALPIISADERRAQRRGVKIVVLGVSGIGKTTQLKSLETESTLFIDLEAGDLSVSDWSGDTIRPRTWPEFRDLVVYLAGPNPALPDQVTFSQAHFDRVCAIYGDPNSLQKYQTYFCDSITALSRLCFTWAKSQPAAVSDRTGKPDNRGAYGLLGQEMISALTHLQHARGKNVVFVAILDCKTDDFGRKVFLPQIEGSATALQLPGIVDEVVTLAEIKAEDGTSYRAFVTSTINPYGYPAKDRSGRLDLLEPPHLGALIAKCSATSRREAPAMASTTAASSTTEFKE
jgi:hypothetical protein